eukprot:TRINITY_DN6603_c0_g2_i5.p1 TRINITY_DN6603_c0_g2~~TRINITY_DN6603_c0_g2_i5.p1  ORF type:complete len:544 (+),score=74.52 TRINITY_DN6603_c0_g2_i5:150-1781(+)
MALWIPYSIVVPCWYILVISLFVWSRKQSKENQTDERSESLINSDSLLPEPTLSLSEPPPPPHSRLSYLLSHPFTGVFVRFLSCSFVFLTAISALSPDPNPLNTALFTDFVTFLIFFIPMTILALIWHRVFPRLAVLAFAARHHSWKYGVFAWVLLKVYPVLSSIVMARASVNWLFPALAWCMYGVVFCVLAIKYTSYNSPVLAFRVSPLWAIPSLILLFLVMFSMQNLYNGLLLFYGDQHWLVFQVLPCVFGVAAKGEGLEIFILSLFMVTYHFFRTLYFIIASCLGIPHSDTPFYRILYHIPCAAPFDFRNVFSYKSLVDGCLCCCCDHSSPAENTSSEGSVALTCEMSGEEKELQSKREVDEKADERWEKKQEPAERLEPEFSNDSILYRPPSRLELLEYKGFYTMSFLVATPIVGPFLYILTSTLCASGVCWIRHWFGSPKELQSIVSQSEPASEPERAQARKRARDRDQRMAQARCRDPTLSRDTESHSEFMEQEYGVLKVIHVDQDRGPYARLATALVLPLIPLWLFVFPEGIRFLH